MPYSIPAGYGGITKTTVENINAYIQRYTFHLNGLATPNNTASLIKTITAHDPNIRTVVSDLLVIASASANPNSLIGLSSRSKDLSLQYSQGDLEILQLFARFGPPKMNIPVEYGDGLDITFNDINSFTNTDYLIFQFVVSQLGTIHGANG